MKTTLRIVLQGSRRSRRTRIKLTKAIDFAAAEATWAAVVQRWLLRATTNDQHIVSDDNRYSKS